MPIYEVKCMHLGHAPQIENRWLPGLATGDIFDSTKAPFKSYDIAGLLKKDAIKLAEADAEFLKSLTDFEDVTIKALATKLGINVLKARRSDLIRSISDKQIIDAESVKDALASLDTKEVE